MERERRAARGVFAPARSRPRREAAALACDRDSMAWRVWLRGRVRGEARCRSRGWYVVAVVVIVMVLWGGGDAGGGDRFRWKWLDSTSNPRPASPVPHSAPPARGRVHSHFFPHSTATSVGTATPRSDLSRRRCALLGGCDGQSRSETKSKDIMAGIAAAHVSQ